MAKERVQYFDILKGIAIFLVVMGHVLTMCIRDIDNDFLFKLIERVHMPVFFFISGYFSYKESTSKKYLVPNIGKRALQLLLPFFVVSFLWILYFPHSGLKSPINASIRGFIFSDYKIGYWFTFCLFESIILYATFIPIFRIVKNIFVNVLIVLLCMLFISSAFGWLSAYTGIKLSELFGLGPLTLYFPIFILGVFAKKNKELGRHLISNNTLLSISLIAMTVLGYISVYSWEFHIQTDVLYFIGFLTMACVVYVAIVLTKGWSEKIYLRRPQGNTFSKIWTYLGQESLGIYLLHYFFLFPLTFLQEPMRAMGLGFVPSLVVSAFVAALIVAVTLGVNYIISQSKLLSLLLIGKNQYKRN